MSESEHWLPTEVVLTLPHTAYTCMRTCRNAHLCTQCCQLAFTCWTYDIPCTWDSQDTCMHTCMLDFDNKVSYFTATPTLNKLLIKQTKSFMSPWHSPGRVHDDLEVTAERSRGARKGMSRVKGGRFRKGVPDFDCISYFSFEFGVSRLTISGSRRWGLVLLSK